MSHALRQHCGSFLYDSIRREWPLPTERDDSQGGAAQESTRVGMAQETAPRPPPQEQSPPSLREWPLLRSPSLTRLQVTGFDSRQGAAFFTILAHMEDVQWTVERTYDEFSVLHKTLVQVCKVDKSLMPGRRFFGFFGPPKREQLEQIQVKLNEFLASLLKFPVPPTDLLKFIDYPFTDVLSVTQALAAFFYSEGESVLANNKAIQMSPLQLHCIKKRLTLAMESSATGMMKDDFGNLLDFLQRLKKLKIAPPTEENYLLSASEDLTFDLTLLKELEVLMIEGVEIRDLRHRSVLPAQLRALEIRRSVTALKDLLVVFPEKDGEEEEEEEEEDRAATPTLSSAAGPRAMQWSFLKHAVFKLCGLKRIDESMCLLPVLERLDLSYNSIEEIENLVDLPHLQVLDLSFNNISSLSSLHTKLGNVEKIALASNKISSLDGIQKVFSLQFIDLSNNDITEFSEAGHLSSLPCLEELYLRGNQIAHSHTYRTNIFSYLNNIASQVALEGRQPSKDELEVSVCLLTPQGHRRVPSRTADIKPDLDDDTESREAEDEFAVTTSVTNQLERMRKEGGDQWLSIFNAERMKKIEERGEGEVEGSELVASAGSHKKKKVRKQQQHQHGHKKGKKKEAESSSVQECDSTQEEERESEGVSSRLLDFIKTQQEKKLQVVENFLVTVLEYGSTFHSLSPSDVDQVLMNTRMEECAVSIDSSLKRALETIVTAGKTRCQRDLALLQDLRIHEGQRLAVCLQFSSFNSPSSWVVYSVRDMLTLARLYVVLQHAADAQTQVLTPDTGPSTLPQLQVTSDEVDGGSSRTQLTQSTGGSSNVSTSHNSSQASSRNHTPVPAELRAPVEPSSPERPRSPSQPLIAPQPTIAAVLTSTSGSSSPKGSKSPTSQHRPGSGTPQSVDLSSPPQSLELAITADQISALKSKVSSILPASAGSSSAEPSPDLHRAKPLTVSSSHKTVKKPSLDSTALMKFFKKSVAEDPTTEILLNVLWCGCSLPSSPGVEIEAGLLISDRAIYILEVLDPERHPKKQFLWSGPGESLPLAPVFKGGLFTLSRVMVGMFDQNILMEFSDKGGQQSLVMFPRTSDKMVMLTENLKVALDACRISYQIMTTEEYAASLWSKSRESSGVIILNSDGSDLLRMKECLVRGRVITKTGNYIATCQGRELELSIGEEVKRITDDSCVKFEISQYVGVNQVSMDILPIANGIPHLRPLTLVLTNDYLYLCLEEIVSWPRDSSSPIQPRYPHCCVLDSHPLTDIQEVRVCDRAQPSASHSNPVYEFAVSFEGSSDRSTTRGVLEWLLCVQEKQYFDQLVLCLSSLWQDARQGQLPVSHTAESIVSLSDVHGSRRPDTATVGDSQKSFRQSSRAGTGGCFVHSSVLVRFASLTNYQRWKMFKKHVAQAEFMKSDESPLSVTLALCSLSQPPGDHLEIEVAVIVSNYCLYLLADVDSIQVWLDGGGPCSFSRMSLLSKKNSSHARCFYHVWLNELKEVHVGLFDLSVRIAEAKLEKAIDIHTQNASATLSLLSALSSHLHLKDSREEEMMEELLSDYIDLAEMAREGNATKHTGPTVEFFKPQKESMDTLKQLLLSISPSITRRSTPSQCVSSMHFLCEQVMLIVEEVRVRDTMAVQSRPHLVLLTNYGLYICSNMASEKHSPAVLTPSDLQVKKWCHIDLVVCLEVTAACSGNNVHVHVRSQKPAAPSDTMSIHLIPQNRELLQLFVHSLSLLWHERCGKRLPVNRPS